MFKRENNAGLYLTIAVHLVLLIVLLASRIHSLISEENAFVLDFTKQEEFEKIREKEQLKEEISNELDAMINGSGVRNVVVDASSAKGQELKDDRYKNPSQVYDEAKRLQERLNAAKREAEAYQGSDDDAAPSGKKENSNNDSYKGPSVVSYNLKERKALTLSIPAYKCLGGGDVSVAIIVNKKGYVTAAEIIEGRSSTDPCLREYAIRAAKNSRFTASATAPERQPGDILYRFIAQ